MKKSILILLSFFFISIMVVSGIKIIYWVSENKQNEIIIENVFKNISIDDTTNNYHIDFSRLKQTNPDTIAWLKVNGTDIDYPVLKSTNNDFYITHSFDKSYNSAGWVFMDYNNAFDGTDKNMVIYGHNRRNSSMFGTLKNILTKEWQSNSDNFIVTLITETEKAEYQVFSVYQIEKEDYYITTNFNNDKEFQKFIDDVKSRSVKNFGIEVTSKDNLLTLSTCANNSQFRIVLHAKKLQR